MEEIRIARDTLPKMAFVDPLFRDTATDLLGNKYKLDRLTNEWEPVRIEKKENFWEW